MRKAGFFPRACLWLLATTIIFVGVNKASAQTGPEADHLKCYQTRDNNPKEDITVLLRNQQFGEEQCQLVTRAPLLCAPTIKNNGNDGLGGLIPAQDYLCYKIQCGKRKKSTHVVRDQFGINGRLMVVGNAQWLCNPALKSEPLECGDTAPLCSGECPTDLHCKSIPTTGAAPICRCVP